MVIDIVNVRDIKPPASQETGQVRRRLSVMDHSQQGQRVAGFCEVEIPHSVGLSVGRFAAEKEHIVPAPALIIAQPADVTCCAAGAKKHLFDMKYPHIVNS